MLRKELEPPSLSFASWSRSAWHLTEAEHIKKRLQEYAEELYKKDLHDPDNHDGVITHLEPTSWNVKLSGEEPGRLQSVGSQKSRT